jgi:putative nucleotidyltransferase with HDIG domain
VKEFKELFDIFERHNKSLYLVGGAARDMLLNRTPKDFDFTTNALPKEIKEILRDNNIKFYDIGEKFGTIAANWNCGVVEITTHRKDLTQGRHPEVAFAASLEEDLLRRDFTINSIAIDKDGHQIDVYGGSRDIKDKIIRATGNPEQRIKEDPLRMLRATRFASQLGFNIEEKTKAAITEYAPLILDISRERWLQEMTKLLLGNNAYNALELLYETRLLGFILPEVYPITMQDPRAKLPSKNLWHHTKLVVSNLPPIDHLRWAGLLHDIMKPQTRIESEEVHFFKHEELAAEIVENIRMRFKMPLLLADKVAGIIKLHHRLSPIVSRRNNPPVSKKGLRRLAFDCLAFDIALESLVLFFEADISSKRPETIERHSAHVSLLRETIFNMKEEDLKPKLPKGLGNVVMEKFSLEPSKQVGEIITQINELLLDGNLNPELTAEEMTDEFMKNFCGPDGHNQKGHLL